jgi:hypothetical protein
MQVWCFSSEVEEAGERRKHEPRRERNTSWSLEKRDKK